MTREQRIEMLKAIYRTLPTMECRGLCQVCCGPVCMTRFERDRIEKHLGDKPVDHMGLACPVLNDAGRCSAYAVRPLICRLWGMVESLKCPHGCEPSRWLTDDEAAGLLAAMNAVGGDAVMFGLDEDDTRNVISELRSVRAQKCSQS